MKTGAFEISFVRNVVKGPSFWVYFVPVVLSIFCCLFFILEGSQLHLKALQLAPQVINL